MNEQRVTRRFAPFGISVVTKLRPAAGGGVRPVLYGIGKAPETIGVTPEELRAPDGRAAEKSPFGRRKAGRMNEQSRCRGLLIHLDTNGDDAD